MGVANYLLTGMILQVCLFSSHTTKLAQTSTKTSRITVILKNCSVENIFDTVQQPKHFSCMSYPVTYTGFQSLDSKTPSYKNSVRFSQLPSLQKETPWGKSGYHHHPDHPVGVLLPFSFFFTSSRSNFGGWKKLWKKTGA